jgi:hypothetical protein
LAASSSFVSSSFLRGVAMRLEGLSADGYDHLRHVDGAKLEDVRGMDVLPERPRIARIWQYDDGVGFLLAKIKS